MPTAEPHDALTPTTDLLTPTTTRVPPSPTPMALTETPPPSMPTPLPSLEPSPTTLPADIGQAITLTDPSAGQVVGNPLRVRGHTLQMPFEGTLVIRVYDAHSWPVAELPIIAEGEYGGPATFDAMVTYGGASGAGRVEVIEFSAMDGSIVAQATQLVFLSGFPGGGTIESPAHQTDVTLPVKLLARVGSPAQEVDVTVRWENGAQFSRTLVTLPGLDGRGLIAVALDRPDSDAVHPGTQPATLEIHTPDRKLLAWQQIRILAPTDSGTMRTTVFWVSGDDEIVPQEIRIPRTLGIGRASLEALLWGPVPGNSAGLTSALPSPQEVLSYPGRDATWGERVLVRSLTIVDRVAYADFSLELSAHSGGALQVTLIRRQIAATLLQFSTVDDVLITINGQPAMLEP